MPVMMVRTSAKSTLIRPGTVTRSLIPRTAFRQTLSTIANASFKVIFRPASEISRSLGITISASTALASSLIPPDAFFLRCEPSNANGLVTTPTVRAPRSRATCAITGAAPVPVPPPIPAVTNTMSAPASASATREASSSAAARPISGFAPAPRPLVRLLPRWTLMAAWFASRTWQSVLATMKSTPSMPPSIIVLMEFPPPPPTPMTLMTGRPGLASPSSNSSIVKSPVLSIPRLESRR